MQKKQVRLRRAKRVRSKILERRVPRLTVHRTPRHIYAQVIAADNSAVVASASTVDKHLRGEIGYGGNTDAAKIVGRAIAERAKQAGVDKVAFDRSGFQYHGRIQALADSARENGLEF